MINKKLLQVIMEVGQPKEGNMYICVHFNIKELVSQAVYNFYKPKYGEKFIWKFFDTQVLKDLDYIRDKWGREIIINNWSTGGSLHQCGLRSNIDPLVKSKSTPYLSGHSLAKGFDLHDCRGQNSKLYDLVCNLIKKKELKAFKRVENIKFTNGWVHVDALSTVNDQLEIFNI